MAQLPDLKHQQQSPKEGTFIVWRISQAALVGGEGNGWLAKLRHRNIVTDEDVQFMIVP